MVHLREKNDSYLCLEDVLSMNIQQILEEIDVLYSQQKIEEVEALLVEKIQELKELKEIYPEISFMNELLGIYREKGDRDKGLALCADVLGVFEENNLAKDENYGTTLLNVATAYRAFGEYEKSGESYRGCLAIYEGTLDKNDYRYASLYNNMSLLSAEMENYQESVEYLKKSLGILDFHENMEVPRATANTSLAQIHLSLRDFASAEKYINIALDLFQGIEDYHYGATLATAGDIENLQQNYEKAVEYYEKSLVQIEKYVGKSENYLLMEERLRAVKEFTQAKGLTLCQEFYKNNGIAMIRTHFPHHEHLIAVGLVGQGSECFGYDDEISQDHDSGLGFSMWLTEEVYEEIGESLQEKYEELLAKFPNEARVDSSGERRTGVFKISEFYANTLEMDQPPVTDEQWLALEESKLAEATNGSVFRDDLGVFSRIRQQLLNYYPAEVYLKKLVKAVHLVSQTGQYNFQRALKRGDEKTASLTLHRFSDSVTELVFLLQRTYAPYYKWVNKKMSQLKTLSTLGEDCYQIQKSFATGGEVIPQVEEVVAKIITELHNQGFIQSIVEGNFLDAYCGEISEMTLDSDLFYGEKEKLVATTVEMEWKAFDKVQGMDGRASCQDDRDTFQIMRTGQFWVWNAEMIRSYQVDFLEALEEGRNLVTNKYAYMMKSTDLENFKEMEDKLPSISVEKANLIEEIVGKQMELVVELEKRFPKFVRNGRSLHSSEDSLYNTSYETYLRGELCAYSLRTVKLYGKMLEKNAKRGLNTAKMFMSNVAIQYGYSDLETAEKNLESGE